MGNWVYLRFAQAWASGYVGESDGKCDGALNRNWGHLGLLGFRVT